MAKFFRDFPGTAQSKSEGSYTEQLATPWNSRRVQELLENSATAHLHTGEADSTLVKGPHGELWVVKKFLDINNLGPSGLGGASIEVLARQLNNHSQQYGVTISPVPLVYEDIEYQVTQYIDRPDLLEFWLYVSSRTMPEQEFQRVRLERFVSKVEVPEKPEFNPFMGRLKDELTPKFDSNLHPAARCKFQESHFLVEGVARVDGKLKIDLVLIDLR